MEQAATAPDCQASTLIAFDSISISLLPISSPSLSSSLLTALHLLHLSLCLVGCFSPSLSFPFLFLTHNPVISLCLPSLAHTPYSRWSTHRPVIRLSYRWSRSPSFAFHGPRCFPPSSITSSLLSFLLPVSFCLVT